MRAADEAGASDDASPLISVLGGHWVYQDFPERIAREFRA